MAAELACACCGSQAFTAPPRLRPYEPTHPRRLPLSSLQGKWTAEEDERLLALVEERGRKWTEIGGAVGRMAEACRDRWLVIRCAAALLPLPPPLPRPTPMLPLPLLSLSPPSPPLLLLLLLLLPRRCCRCCCTLPALLLCKCHAGSCLLSFRLICRIGAERQLAVGRRQKPRSSAACPRPDPPPPLDLSRTPPLPSQAGRVAQERQVGRGRNREAEEGSGGVPGGQGSGAEPRRRRRRRSDDHHLAGGHRG